MSLPQGAVWQALRAKALDTIPHACRVVPSDYLTLEQWLSRGAYSVQAASKNKLVLEVPSHDIGGVLASEAGLLLDHALEHALTLRHQIQSCSYASPAWQSVTLYYWAYFLVMSLTRLIGETPWFLSSDEAKILSGLSPGNKVGAGPKIIRCGSHISGTMREVEIRSSSSTRLHDIVWRLYFDVLRALTSNKGTLKSTAEELRVYLPQVLTANRLGPSWPSDFRNLVNYVPGLAYGSARGRSPTATFGTVPLDPAWTSEVALDRLEDDATALSGSLTIDGQLNRVSRVLMSLTSILDLLTHTLFDEVLQRQQLDKRWLFGRRTLVRACMSPFATSSWPVGNSAA